MTQADADRAEPADAGSRHRAPGRPARGERDWPFIAVGIAAGLAALLCFVEVAEAITRNWAGPPGALVLVGWLPHAGFLLLMGLVALRHFSLAGRGRRRSRLEETFCGLLGMAWGGAGFALLGARGVKVVQLHPDEVTDQVAAASSEHLATGLALGQVSWLLVVVLAVGYLLARLPFVPKPGWRPQSTLMLLLWGPAALTGILALATALMAQPVSLVTG